MSIKTIDMEDYKKKYEEALGWMKSIYPTMKGVDKEDAEHYFPELKESKDERIRKALISFLKSPFVNENITDEKVTPWIAWLEKQGEQKPAEVRTTGYWNVQDIEQKPAWSEEDEIGLGDALWAIQQARTIAKDENDMGNLWYAENWLKTLKDRVQPQNTWKPSDEQMRVLKKACDEHWEPDGLEPLYTLYQDLEKLRE